MELRLQYCDCYASSPERSHDLRRHGAPDHVLGYFGSWHVRTPNYRADAEVCLWLPPEPVPVGYILEPSGEAYPVGGTAAAAPSQHEMVPQGLPAVREPTVAATGVVPLTSPTATPVAEQRTVPLGLPV